MKKIDLTGQRFGRLYVICDGGRTKEKQAMWKCKCDCGNIVTARGGCLRNGHTSSCGCKTREATIKRNYKHGDSHTRLHGIWRGILKRTIQCKETNPDWAKYAGRGISVCAEWANSFEAFKSWALANGYDDSLSIDRIDYNGNYSPDNCRWASDITQANNRRNNVVVFFNGKSRTIAEWARETGIHYQTLMTRYLNGLSGDDLFAPVKKGCATS